MAGIYRRAQFEIFVGPRSGETAHLKCKAVKFDIDLDLKRKEPCVLLVAILA